MRMESIWLTPALQQHFSRLKTLGGFRDDQDLIRALFNAWEQNVGVGENPPYTPPPLMARYMSRPGLGPEDYDT